ncbi:DNA-binding transcriptional repressor FabR [Anatilimnocola aggregata]|uniref:DNA-binding transcriptional repressor FabR n=1 Tax=Anatilimnocola aggregata TaxID=2528021 RepID=A0A517YAZ3_9BACT|nr:TetR/AcrR family transcriptional regulator [Anatilimnocola aggregata]QDU27400.1 DNA-binding transcriptional repressor FabR [Anatilimnocola aggregata]
MSIVERRQRQKLETRERMLDACRELLLTEGFHGLSMRKLAAKIGYSPTAIYFHFPDKEALLGELVEREFMKFRRSFDQAGQPGLDPIERLRRMGMIYVDFGLEQTSAYKFLFMNTQIEQFPKIGLIEHGNPAQDCYAYLRATVAEGLAAGRFRSELTSADQIAQLFFSGTHGVVSLHLARGKDPWVAWCPVHETARLMIDAIIRGLTQDAPQSAPPEESLP